MSTQQYKKIYIVICVAAVCLYGGLLFGESVWLDESFSMALVRETYRQMCMTTASDVHPPLYYAILKFIAEPFGFKLSMARFVSAIPYLVIIIVGGWKFHKLFGNRVSLCFMGLFLLFPFALNYATEIRMYSWAACFVLFAGIYAYEAYQNGKIRHYIVFALLSTAAAYTHYFALVSVGVMYGMLFILLLIKRRKKQLLYWLIALAIIILCYLPWLGFFVKQLAVKVEQEYWIPDITWHTFVEYIIDLFSVKGLPAFVALLPCGIYLFALVSLMIDKGGRLKGAALCALLVPVATVLVGVVASVLVRPVFIIRYIAPSVPLLVLFMAMALSSEKVNRQIRMALLAILILCGVIHCAKLFKDEYFLRSNEVTASYLARYEYDEIVISGGYSVYGPMSCYELEKPIYCQYAGFYPNTYPMEDYGIGNQNTALLFVENGYDIPENLSSGFSVEYIENAYFDWDMVSVYQLKNLE